MKTTGLQAPIGGWCASGYEIVRDAFAANFVEHGEVGGALAVYAGDRPVVSLWGGVADQRSGRLWSEDTIAIVFSMTKGLTATCVHHLAERGAIDLDAKVVRYWPEFGAAGKGSTTVRMLLGHRAGLPAVDAELTLDQALAWTPVVRALECQEPFWEPGRDHGYHLRTFGWLVGEVFRRVSGRTVGRYFAEEIARPLELDWQLGTPARDEARVARLVTPPPAYHAMIASLPEDFLLRRALGAPSNLFHYNEMWNEPRLHAVEFPSSNSLARAPSVARLYAALLPSWTRTRVLANETVAAACHQVSRGLDRVLLIESAFGSGYQLPPMLPSVVGPHAFGHSGAGGAMSFADPAANLAFAYIPNRLRIELGPDPRTESLANAVYAAHVQRG
jgi:CubicO group peptidase (beta-lactamase class C family)